MVVTEIELDVPMLDLVVTVVPVPMVVTVGAVVMMGVVMVGLVV